MQTVIRKSRNQGWYPYLFVSPFFILFCIFGLYPILYSITTSFFDWKLIGTSAPRFVGLGNYTNVLTQDPFFWKALMNTVILLVTGSLLQHFIAIPLAIMINSKAVKGKEFFKTSFFLPYITSTVSVVIIFGVLFDTNYGIVNWLIGFVSDSAKIRWLQESFGIKVVLSVVLNWKYIGWNMVIYLAGLQAIPMELYEAAMIDGASTLRKHISITIPQLLPIIFFGVALSIIGGMQIFEEPFILTGGYEQLGGHQNSGLTAAYYLMFTAFKAYRLGKGSAIAWLIFLVILVLNGVNRYVTKKLEG
jgi:ABC-type sugar transport system permease subunit